VVVLIDQSPVQGGGGIDRAPVNASCAVRWRPIRRGRLVAVEHDVVVLGQGTIDLDTLAGILRRHALEVIDERLLAITESSPDHPPR
jgi:hypothetical protein